MKKLLKTIGIYLGVILLASLATVVFCGAFLFFYRDGNIFGIKYISADEVLYAKESEDMSQLEEIEVESGGFDVYIRVNSSVDTLTGAMRNKVFGYTKKSKAQASFSMEYDEINKRAVFDSKEPSGWLSKRNSYIEIAVPKWLAEKGFDLTVRASKADIIIGGDVLIKIDNLNIKSSKGDTRVYNVELKNHIDLKVGSGSAEIKKSCKAQAGISASISLDSGVINLANTSFEFDIIEIKSIKRGRIGILKAGEIFTNGNIAGGGKLEIKEVKQIEFLSLDTDVRIGTIDGQTQDALLQSRIDASGHGSVKVDKAMCDLVVDGNNGNIYVGTSIGTVDLSTNHGNIKMDNALKLVSATTNYGDINVKFSDSALEYNPSEINQNNHNRKIIATTQNGHIIVDGLQNGNITATKKGRISLIYDKVVGENVISAQMGRVDIIVPCPTETSSENEFAFNLKISSEVNSDIKVGVVGELNGVDYSGDGDREFINIYNSGVSTSNNLKVETTTGPIKIRSLDLIEF